MKIVLVSDCFLPGMGGIETQVAGLAEREALDGNDVTVLTCQPGRRQRSPYRVLRSPWKNRFDWPISPFAPRQFGDFIAATKPDVVHLHMGELTPVVQAMLPRLAREGQNTVVTVHSVWNEKLTIPLLKLAVALAGLKDSHIKWTGVSELVAGRIRKVIGTEHVSVLPNGVDGQFWRVQPEPHDGLLSVAATRFAPRKRVPELLEILRISGAPAVLAGGGPGLEQAQQFVAKHGLQVELPGRLTAIQLRRLYSRADVFLGPGVVEASPVAAAEAQAAGLAILTRSQSGLGERISSREGAVADTDDEFARILEQWKQDPTLVQPIKEHNLATVCPLDWSLTMPKVYDLYAS